MLSAGQAKRNTNQTAQQTQLCDLGSRSGPLTRCVTWAHALGPYPLCDLGQSQPLCPWPLSCMTELASESVWDVSNTTWQLLMLVILFKSTTEWPWSLSL